MFDGKIKRCTIYDHFDAITSEVTQKLDKQKGATLHMMKWNNPGNCNGKQKADKRGEGEIKHVPIYPFPDTINTRSVRKRESHMILS